MESDPFLIAVGLKTKATCEIRDDVKDSMPVSKATKWYLDTVTATVKSRYSQIWEPMVFRKFSEYFRDKKLNEIGLAELLEYQSWLLNREHLAPQTVNRRFNSIRSFFKTFEETKGLPNPCRNLKKLKIAEQRHFDVLSDSEQARLVLAANSWVQPIIQMANITGMRRSELINLRVSSVNLEEGYVIVEASEGFQTKNRKSRRLPLTEELAEILTPLVKARSGPNALLFVDDRGRAILPDRITKVMRKLMKRVLGRTSGGVHILRHSALTSMIRHGADVESVRRVAGHSSLIVTQRYLSSADEQLKRAMSRQKFLPTGGSVAIGGDGVKIGVPR